MFTTWMQYLQARFASDERGAAAVEYALLVSVIAIAIIFAMSGLATKISDTFSNVAGHLG